MDMEDIIEKYNELQKNQGNIRNELNKLPIEYFSLFQEGNDYNLVLGNMLLEHMEEGNSPERIGYLIGNKRSEEAFTQTVKDQINKVHMLGYGIDLENEDAEKVIQTYYNDLGLNIDAKILDEFTLTNAFDREGAGFLEDKLEKKELAMDEILKEFDKDYVKLVSFSDSGDNRWELGYASMIANMLSQHGKVAEVNTATKKSIYTPVGNTTIDVEYR